MNNRFFSFVVFLFVVWETNSQNLVPNPSFEEFENGCPENLNEMPIGWTWWRESPNSFSTCVQPEELIDSLGWAPWNGFGWQIPYEGSSYIGLAAFSPNPKPGFLPEYREYLGCQLSEPLQVGETYYVSLKTSLAWGNYYGCYWASDRLGAIFTTEGDYDWQDNPFPVSNFAHIYSAQIISDTINWVTVAGSFVADQPYQFMAIGVFFQFDSLQTESFKPGNSSLGSYYYIDQLVVSNDPIGLFEEDDIAEDEIIIVPNPASELVRIKSNDCMRSVRLYNLCGKCVITTTVNNTSCFIDLNQIPAGSYVLEVDNVKEIKREKLVVVH